VIAVRSQLDGDLLTVPQALEDGGGVLGGEVAERCHPLQGEARLAGAIEGEYLDDLALFTLEHSFGFPSATGRRNCCHILTSSSTSPHATRALGSFTAHYTPPTARQQDWGRKTKFRGAASCY